MIVNTLFVGDLPQFCTEIELAHLFSSFGPLVDVKIKRSINNGRALTYGFVTLSTFQGAEAARIRLDGIRWASQNPRAETHNGNVINSVYIRYSSPRMDRTITEFDLHRIFLRYGAIEDVAIKESSVDQRAGRQCGYGFVHFSSQRDGVTAALNAVQTMDNATIDNITFNVELSRNLLKQFGELASATSTTSSQQASCSQLPNPPALAASASFPVAYQAQAMPPMVPHKRPNTLQLNSPIINFPAQLSPASTISALSDYSSVDSNPSFQTARMGQSPQNDPHYSRNVESRDLLSEDCNRRLPDIPSKRFSFDRFDSTPPESISNKKQQDGLIGKSFGEDMNVFLRGQDWKGREVYFPTATCLRLPDSSSAQTSRDGVSSFDTLQLSQKSIDEAAGVLRYLSLF
eukprot:scaffold7410_cov169-Ochromonas_danica.AAC.16